MRAAGATTAVAAAAVVMALRAMSLSWTVSELVSGSGVGGVARTGPLGTVHDPDGEHAASAEMLIPGLIGRYEQHTRMGRNT